MSDAVVGMNVAENLEASACRAVQACVRRDQAATTFREENCSLQLRHMPQPQNARFYDSMRYGIAAGS